MNETGLHIKFAVIADAAAITRLLNHSYRGETSRLGWTTEAHLIAGNTRTNEQEVRKLLQMPGNVFLVLKNKEQEVEACVNLQLQIDVMYLGMLAVTPMHQNEGMGKHLLKAAESYAISCCCNSIFMTVITARTELIAWYKRHGYEDTGSRKEFVEDSVSGKHLTKLEFMFLRKKLQAV